MVCYTRFRAFATMMTGNMIMMCVTWGTNGIHVSKDEEDDILADVPFYLIVILMYFIGVVMYRMVEVRIPSWAGTILSPVICLLIIVEELALAISDIPSRWCCFMLAPVFGMQNSAVSRKGISIPTAFATGHIHIIGYALAAALQRQCGIDACKHIMLNIGAVVGLSFGVATGAMVIARQEVPQACAEQNVCTAAMNLTTGNCCPLASGEYLECCDMTKYGFFLLSPIAPAVALLLALHEWTFLERTAPAEADLSQPLGDMDLAQSSDVFSFRSVDQAVPNVTFQESS